MRLKERPNDPWYAIADLPPPYTVKVEVLIRGRHFIASRGRHHKHPAVVVWCEWVRDSERHLLDPDICDAMNDGEGVYRPMKPESWAAALPEPVRQSMSGIFANQKQRFAAVDEAEAADLAREMERDRQMARDSRSEDGESVRKFELQWWRDHSLIRYEKPEDATIKMIEGRVMRAVACCGVARHVPQMQSLLRLLDDEAVRLHAEKENNTTPDFVPHFQPLPADFEDWLTAMSWFTALYPVHQRPKGWTAEDMNKPQEVLIFRAGTIALSFAEIGKELGWKGHQRASQVYKEAIEDCWRMAARQTASHRTAQPVDLMAELRERNRAARREAVA